MKAITLWQPWATAIALGKKRIETRSWSTPYRGPIAIHAAKRPMDPEEAIVSRACFGTQDLPYGAIVAVCDLVACEPTAYLRPSASEAAWGNFTPGRWGWVLDNIVPLDTPLFARGFQQIWEWTPPVGWPPPRADGGGE